MHSTSTTTTYTAAVIRIVIKMNRFYILLFYIVITYVTSLCRSRDVRMTLDWLQHDARRCAQWAVEPSDEYLCTCGAYHRPIVE